MKKGFWLFEIVLVLVIVFTACSNPEPEKNETSAFDTEVKNDEADTAFALQSAQYRSLVFNAEEQPNSMLEAYRNVLFREKVIEFFGAIIYSNELAELVLKEAEERNINPALALALSWEESRFNQKAVNRNLNNSIDRGLFQLNSSSFPNLKEADFFDPATNTRYALAHLRWCLDYAKSDVAGLAMYNAGLNRVRNGETPKKTLDYVSRILNASQKIEELFLAEMSVWIAEEEAEAAALAAAEEEPDPIVLIPVDSLALAWAGFLSTYP